jgi:hypothetical protein
LGGTSARPDVPLTIAGSSGQTTFVLIRGISARNLNRNRGCFGADVRGQRQCGNSWRKGDGYVRFEESSGGARGPASAAARSCCVRARASVASGGVGSSLEQRVRPGVFGSWGKACVGARASGSWQSWPGDWGRPSGSGQGSWWRARRVVVVGLGAARRRLVAWWCSVGWARQGERGGSQGGLAIEQRAEAGGVRWLGAMRPETTRMEELTGENDPAEVPATPTGSTGNTRIFRSEICV